MHDNITYKGGNGLNLSLYYFFNPNQLSSGHYQCESKQCIVLYIARC